MKVIIIVTVFLVVLPCTVSSCAKGHPDSSSSQKNVGPNLPERSARACDSSDNATTQDVHEGVAQAVITISLSSSNGEVMSYVITEHGPCSVEIELRQGEQSVSTRSFFVDGGIVCLRNRAKEALAEMDNVRDPHGSTNDPSYKWLKLSIIENGIRHSSTIAGDRSGISSLYYQLDSLHEILRMVSLGQPKAFRLVHDDDNSKMPPKK